MAELATTVSNAGNLSASGRIEIYNVQILISISINLCIYKIWFEFRSRWASPINEENPVKRVNIFRQLFFRLVNISLLCIFATQACISKQYGRLIGVGKGVRCPKDSRTANRCFIIGRWRDGPNKKKKSKRKENLPALKAVSVLFNVSKQSILFGQRSSSSGSTVLIINVFCSALAVVLATAAVAPTQAASLSYVLLVYLVCENQQFSPGGPQRRCGTCECSTKIGK